MWNKARFTCTLWLAVWIAQTCSGDPPDSKTPLGGCGVTFDRLRRADEEPGNWLMYSGQYHGRRFSRLDEIAGGNVQDLRLRWVRQFPTLIKVETSPLVVDGTMYVTLPKNLAMALDAGTGSMDWPYEHPLTEEPIVCCGKVNRGFAILGNTLYMGTLDARLIALDRKSGDVLWDVQVADPKTGHSITAAPLVVKDMVITGIAGGEFGIRGFIDAYDAATGERRWRTDTIPNPGETGNDTWGGDSWEHGGAPTWLTGSYDPELDLVYWGTGNPSPDWNGTVRPGDNLYSNCMLALDADTGRMKWHFQFTPHDVHDWDACQIPVLVDAEWNGTPRKLLLLANRNAFFYVLDRRTGEFLLARQFAEQTWAKRVDEKGRPVVRLGSEPTKEGTEVAPDAFGAANWWSPAFSPRTGLFYLMAFDGSDTYYMDEAGYEPGALFAGGGPTWCNSIAPDLTKCASAVRALDPLTGEQKWEYPVLPRSTSGLLATAGDVVFGGTKDGVFFALDARTGKALWSMSVGGRVHAAPVTFLVDGRQYVAVAAGNALYAFSL